MLSNKLVIAFLAIGLCAFSFAAGGLTNWLAGEKGGREVYRVGERVFTEHALEEELKATIALHPGIKQSDHAVIQGNSNFRAAFLRSRYNGDILTALAEKEGLLATPEADAWLRIAAREAVRQFCMSRMTPRVSVSSNEVVEFYDANASSLAHLSINDALMLIEERLLQQKQQEALFELVAEAEKTLPARLALTNW